MSSRGLWLQGCFLTVGLTVWIQPASAQGASAEVTDARVGQTATLPALVIANPFWFSWFKGTERTESRRIYTYLVLTSEEVTGPQYTGRETGRRDGSLEIRDLLMNYTGNYTVFVSLSPSGTPSVEASRELRVYELVTKPTVTWAPSQLVENRGPAVITCDTPKASIVWSFNRSPDLPANIRPSPDNRTLTIANVSRGDSGTYQCEALNPVSSSASDPQTLTVAYGPEDVKIDPPGPHCVQNRTKLSLSCIAESFPQPWYQWFLNDDDLNSTVSTYTVEKVSSRDNGIYTCVAHNTVTGLAAKASVYIVVTGRPCPTSGSCWQTTLGVAGGVILGAAIIVAGMAVHYERRLKQKDTNKDEDMYQNPSVINNHDIQYENMRKGREGHSAQYPVPELRPPSPH